MGHEGYEKVIKNILVLKNQSDESYYALEKGKGINAETFKYTDSKNKIINSGNITTFKYSVVSENRLST